MIRVVCFDLGGVMVRIRHRWSEILAVMGKELPSGFKADRLAEHQLLSNYQASEISEEAFIAKLANELDLSREDAKIAHGMILMEEYSGASILVDEIKSGGIKAACLSNTNALHYEELLGSRFPVCKSFSVLMASHLVGVNKPDPVIYRYLEDAVGARGDEIIFFDDLPANVEAARKAGWLAERVDPNGDPVAFIREELSRLGLKVGQP
ncbi:MAG: HAD-IA family hydrolase [Fimbriimonadaceae bacterium]|nr:HAD-IA family hydrolase [Fimbriimonadaceae bacterium]